MINELGALYFLLFARVICLEGSNVYWSIQETGAQGHKRRIFRQRGKISEILRFWLQNGVFLSQIQIFVWGMYMGEDMGALPQSPLNTNVS